MSKIKCLVVDYGKYFPYTIYITKHDFCYNEIDIACHHMSNSSWTKYNKEESYLEEWIEKNIEFIDIKKPSKLLDYLIEWGYLG